ncbi:MAG TPA: baseplate J/gp47 family protein [Candidatus Elarobacter sp.]|nr:baseplate J/gp47 family protein [Candidatus Elarobacter sp.]
MSADRSHDRTLIALDPALRGLDGAVVKREPGRAVVTLHFVPAAPGVTKAAIPDLDELRGGGLRIEGRAARGWSVVRIARAQGGRHGVDVELTRGTPATPLDEPVTIRLSGVANVAPTFDAVAVNLVAPSATDDVEPVAPPAPPAPPSARIDYLTKDYAGFRQLMLDRMAATLPAWNEPHVADEGAALVELLSYAADYLSYYQDAVATEAYLGTARRRTSVRRHARLLEYRMHEGCTPRVWLHFEVPPSGDPAGPVALHLRKGFYVGPDAGAGSPAASGAFATLEDVIVSEAGNAFDLDDGGLDTFTLAAGATRATLALPPGTRPRCARGDVLILEQAASPVTGDGADADPRLRQAVRLVAPPRRIADPLRRGVDVWEVTWHDRDALRFALPVATRAPSGTRYDRLAHALGNNVAADYGTPQEELLFAVPPDVPYRPNLLRPDVTFAVPYDAAAERERPAAALAETSPWKALPNVVLTEQYQGGVQWNPARDLLEAVRDAALFAVDVDSDGIATLRFGDSVAHGRMPHPGALFRARYRTGNGPAGHLGADRLVSPLGYLLPDATPAGSAVSFAIPQRLQQLGITVRNPVPPDGGVAPEDADAVRLLAPQAARTPKSAVTASDYAERAQAIPGVRAASAAVEFTGSWQTVRVFVQSAARRDDETPAFLRLVRDALEPFRLANADLLVVGPTYVTVALEIEIAFEQTIAADATQHERVRARVDAALAALLAANAYSFGDPVFASPFVAAAMSVPGVVDARVKRLARAGVPNPADGDPDSAAMGAHEIARIPRALVTFAGASAAA